MNYLEEHPEKVKNASYYRRQLKKSESKIEELQALIAMKDAAIAMLIPGLDDYWITTPEGKQALSATSADVEAWLREEKAKVLEDAAIYLDEHCCATGHITSDSTLQELQRMAAELRKNGGK